MGGVGSSRGGVESLGNGIGSSTGRVCSLGGGIGSSGRGWGFAGCKGNV